MDAIYRAAIEVIRVIYIKITQRNFLACKDSAITASFSIYLSPPILPIGQLFNLVSYSHATLCSHNTNRNHPRSFRSFEIIDSLSRSFGLYHVSIACCADLTSPSWQNTRALPYSSSISNVSGAVLAQFLQPAANNEYEKWLPVYYQYLLKPSLFTLPSKTIRFMWDNNHSRICHMVKDILFANRLRSSQKNLNTGWSEKSPTSIPPKLAFLKLPRLGKP